MSDYTILPVHRERLEKALADIWRHWQHSTITKDVSEEDLERLEGYRKWFMGRVMNEVQHMPTVPKRMRRDVK